MNNWNSIYRKYSKPAYNNKYRTIFKFGTLNGTQDKTYENLKELAKVLIYAAILLLQYLYVRVRKKACKKFLKCEPGLFRVLDTSINF